MVVINGQKQNRQKAANWQHKVDKLGCSYPVSNSIIVGTEIMSAGREFHKLEKVVFY